MNFVRQSKNVYSNVSLACGLSAFVIGFFAVVVRLVGLRIHAVFVPISLDSAGTLVILSGSLIFHFYIPEKTFARRILRAMVSLVCLFQILLLIDIISEVNLIIENLLFSIYKTIGTTQVLLLSPFTSGILIVTALSLLLLVSFYKKPAIKTAASGIALLVFALGIIISVGYFYGTPILYGGPIRPTSLETGLGLALMGLGLICTSGPSIWPLRALTGETTNARLLRYLLPFIIVLVLAEGWVLTTFHLRTNINPALVSTLIAILGITFISVIVSQVTRIISAAIDSAEARARQAAEKLRQSEERFRSLIENSSDIISLVDVSANIRYVSPSVQNIFGYAPDALVSRNIFDFFFQEDRHYLKDAFEKKAGLPGAVISVSGRFRHKDGSLRFVEGTFNNLTENSAIASIVLTFRDVTERKQMDEALKQSEEWFKLLFENSPVAISVTRNGSFMNANSAFLSLFGYKDISEIYGKAFIDLVAPDKREKISDNLQKREIEVPVTNTFETISLKKDGTQFSILTIISRIELPDGPANIAFYSDLTVRKRLETEKDEYLQRLVKTSGLASEQELRNIEDSLNRTKNLIGSLLNILRESNKEQK